MTDLFKYKGDNSNPSEYNDNKKSTCKTCGQPLTLSTPNRLSIVGMYDMHCFKNYEGSTVDEVLNNWLEDISTPTPAIIGKGDYKWEHDDIGPTSLCPVSVMFGDQTIRQVGFMLYADNEERKPNPEELEKYRQALLSDPDIPRLLAEQAAT